MNLTSRLPRLPRLLRSAGAIALIAGGLVLAVGQPAAHAAPAGKVTICHRTHSTTNPYRRITVSVSSVNGSSANDHTHHTGSPFDPTFSYPPNAKNWGDIIPDNASGGAGAGLNWTAVGQAIYDGTSYNSIDYAGTCGAMSAQQFYDTEVAAGVPVEDILLDLDDQAADEDAAVLAEIGSFSNPTGGSASFAPSTTTTTTSSTTTTTTTTVAPPSSSSSTTSTTAVPTSTSAPATTTPTATTTPPVTTAPTTPTPGTVTSRVEGVAWIDSDRDGILDAGEPRLPGIVVALRTGTDETRTEQIGGFGRHRRADAPVATTLTASDGSYSFPVVAPGSYEVVGLLSAPGLERTWDTDGSADWRVGVVAPAGGVGRADVAAVGQGALSGTVVQQGTQRPIANALVGCRWSGVDGIDGTGDDVLFQTVADAMGRFGVSDIPFGGFVCGGIDPVDGRTSSLASTSLTTTQTATVVIPVASPPLSGALPVTGGRSMRVLIGLALVLIGFGIAAAAWPRRRPATVRVSSRSR